MRPDIERDHADLCGCAKPDDCFGGTGWHCAVSDGTEISAGGNVITKGTVFAYERCPAYWGRVRVAHEGETVRRSGNAGIFNI